MIIDKYSINNSLCKVISELKEYNKHYYLCFSIIQHWDIIFAIQKKNSSRTFYEIYSLEYFENILEQIAFEIL